MSVKIKLARQGKIRTPHFRIVVADSRTARNGRAIEEIGRYSPTTEPSLIEVKSDRVQYWMGVGAEPTEAVAALLKITGDWQKFYDLPGKEGTLRTIAAKPEKRIAYEAAVKEAANEPKDGATTLKKKAADRLAAKSTPEATPEVAASEPVAEAAVVEAAPATEVTAVVEEAVSTEAASEAPATEN